jgi:hypothetical protein
VELGCPARRNEAQHPRNAVLRSWRFIGYGMAVLGRRPEHQGGVTTWYWLFWLRFAPSRVSISAIYVLRSALMMIGMLLLLFASGAGSISFGNCGADIQSRV